jgi:hypothetical protein
MSRQDAAAASHKFTWPRVKGAPPELTDAVSVITVPAATEAASLPFTAMVRFVAVLDKAKTEGTSNQKSNISAARARTDTGIRSFIRRQLLAKVHALYHEGI